MGELLEFIKEKYSKNNSNSDDMLQKTKVKNTIASMCDTYLKNPGDELILEVLPRDLPYAVSVLNEEPLKSKFIINQISETLFSASLKEIEL